uniref:Uncharacterized protein n=1 Tax=Setaria viridis TaxID=4556 RepID=A0A4U6SSK8_SETVI|nr:hypothetical protein SEVIR_9G123732v2 [Setaria viridis]
MLPTGTVGDVGQESRSLSPSRMQIRLPCRSLMGGSPSMPPSGEQQNPSVSSPARLPKSKRRASTSASQPPRWVPSASPPRHALWGRESMGGRTPGSSRRLVLVPVLEKFSEPSEKRVSVNPDLKSVCLNPNQKLVPKEKAPICSANYIGKEEEGGSQNHSSIAAHTLAH